MLDYSATHIYRNELAAGPMGIPTAGLRRASHMQQSICDHIHSGKRRRLWASLRSIAINQIKTTMSSMILSKPKSFEQLLD